ncbi:MAG: hypothetical protein GQ564_02270 [Bacteroidales bacterium]|nr:hypothetical protein [Bacteroidales bacterium]
MSEDKHVNQKQENSLSNLDIDGNNNVINYAPVQQVHVEQQVVQVSADKITQQALIKRSPYKGLKRFNAKDKETFFGRDELINELFNAINTSKIILVGGASGSGKSSVVRAGVIPKLSNASTKLFDFIFTPGINPFESFYNCMLQEEKDYEFNAEQVKPLLTPNEKTLENLIISLKTEGESWLIFIDQFEEIFTNCADDEKRKYFIDGLVNLVNHPDQSVKIVLAMRADFLEQFSFYPQLTSLVKNNIHLVSDMQAKELKQAIELPAALHGVVYEKGLVDLIIKDIHNQKGYLPLLQYTLNLIWEYECRNIGTDGNSVIENRILSISAYNSLGGVRGALQERIASVYEKLNQEEKETTKQIFLRLVNITESESGSQPVSRRANLSEFAGEIIQKLLRIFVSENLLVTSTDDTVETNTDSLLTTVNKGTVEITHESILHSWENLKKWLEQEKETIIYKNQLADEVKRWMKVANQLGKEKAKSELLKGVRLQRIIELKNSESFNRLGGLSEEENDFIKHSINFEQHQIKIKKRIKQAFICTFFLILTVITLAFLNAEKAKKNIATKLADSYWDKSKMAIKNKDNLLAYHWNALATNIAPNWNIANPIAIDTRPEWTRIILRNKISVPDLFHRFYYNGETKPPLSENGNIDPQLASSLKIINETFEIRKWNLNKVHTLILVVHKDSTLRIWGVASQQQIGKSMNHDAGINGGIFNKNETQILSWSKDHTCRLWDVESQEQIGKSMMHNASVYYAIFNDDGTKVLSCGRDKTARLWSVKTQKQIGNSMLHEADVKRVIFNNDESKILSASWDATVRLWDAKSQKQIGKSMKHDRQASGAIFNKDETQILSWGQDNSIRLWDTESQQQIGNSMYHETSVIGAIFNKDETRILSWSFDNTSRLWEIKSQEQIGNSMKHKDIVNGAIFNENETKILSWGEDSVISLWDIRSTKQNNIIIKHKERVLGSIFNKNQSQLITSNMDGTVRIWDIASQKQVGNSMQHEKPVLGAKLNNDETRILSWSYDKTICIWDMNTQKQIGNSMKHNGIVAGAVFNNDETKILSFSADSTVRLWDVQTQLQIGIPMKHEGSVLGAIFNNDETQLLSWSKDKTIRLWDLKSQKQIGNSMKHDHVVYYAVFNKSETKILSSSNDFTARIWDTQTQKQIGNSLKHNSVVYRAYFNKDETKVLSGTSNGQIYLWDVNTRQQIGNPMKHDKGILGLCFNYDETHVLSWSRDNTARIWDVGVQKQIGNTMKYNTRILNAKFSEDNTQILIQTMKELASWDLNEMDDHSNFSILEAEVFTGTRLNTATGDAIALSVEEFNECREKYIKIAGKHYKECDYPETNLFGIQYTKEANK